MTQSFSVYTFYCLFADQFSSLRVLNSFFIKKSIILEIIIVICFSNKFHLEICVETVRLFLSETNFEKYLDKWDIIEVVAK